MRRIWALILALSLALAQSAPAQKSSSGEKKAGGSDKSKSGPKAEEVAKAEPGAELPKGESPAKTPVKPAGPGKDGNPAKNGDSSKPADDKTEDPLAKVFGEGGVNVKAEKIYSEIDPETSELKTMHMEGKVIVKSEQMNIDCDDLFIDMEKQQMVARGQLVTFSKADVNGTCGRLTYDIENKKSLLEGKPKPIINQKDANGGNKRTSANKITMVQNEKSNNIQWDGDVEFDLPGSGPVKEKEPEKKEAGQKIDNNSVDKLRATSPEKPEKPKIEKSRSPVSAGTK